MGFIDSVLLLFILGWISSYLYKRYLRKRNKDWLFFLGAIILICFWLIDILLYIGVIDMIWLNTIPWVNIPLNVPSGQYYLWNSFLIIGIDFHLLPTAEMFSIAILILLSYPLWLKAGMKVGRILHGYYTHEEGIIWLLKSRKTPNKT